MTTMPSLKYSAFQAEIEKRYDDTDEPFRICGLSLGAMLALDYTIRHKEKVDSLILLAAQYKSPTIFIDISILLPQAELHIIPGAGHEINKDAPEEIADILKL